MIVHDVREMEAPLPLVSTLKKLHSLPPGERLLMIHRMHPCKLAAELERLGFSHEERDLHDRVEITIWRDFPIQEQG